MEVLTHIISRRSWEDAYKAMTLEQETGDKVDSITQDRFDAEDTDQFHRHFIERYGEK